MRLRIVYQFALALLLCTWVIAGHAAPAPETTEPKPPAAAQPPPIDEGAKVENPPEKLQLTYVFDKDKPNRYQVQIMNNGSFRLLNQAQETKLDTITEMFFRQTVKSEESGNYKIEWALLSGEIRIPGYGTSGVTIPEITYTMDNRGNVTKISGMEKLAILPGKPQQKAFAEILAKLRFMGFPLKDLKVGDEWTREYTLDAPDNEKLSVKCTSKLIGYERYDSFDCAKIETKYDYPVKLMVSDESLGNLRLEGKESGSIVTRFAYKEGKLIRSEADVKSESKLAKPDGTLGENFVKMEINVVSRLLPPLATDSKEGE